jgi:hypothetical protein
MSTDFFIGYWTPAITVRVLILTVISLMTDTISTLGSTIETSDDQKRKFAKDSWNWNVQDATFCALFKELLVRKEKEDRDRKEVDKRAIAIQTEKEIGDRDDESLESKNGERTPIRKRQRM